MRYDPGHLHKMQWNDWTRAYPVILNHETVPKPRNVRLTCAAMRVGDPVEVSDDHGWVAVGHITRIEAAIVHVKLLPAPTS